MFGDKEFGKNAGYPTPVATPTDLTCLTLKLPANAEWWAVYSGLLLTLTYEDSWQQFEGGITREQAAHCAMEIYLAAIEAAAEVNNCGGCALPSGSAVVGLDELGSWRMLDNGDWGEPSGDYTLPDYTPRTEPTADERKCLAAKNAVNVMSLIYEKIADDVSHGLTLAEIVFNVGLTIGLLIAPPLGALALAVIQIGINAFRLVTAVAEFITEDVWDESFTDSFTCLLLDNATDTAGVVTFDFNGVRSGLVSMTNWLSPTLLEQQLAAQVDNILQNIGAEGLNLAGETTAIEDSDCSMCDEAWCYQWLPAAGNDWTIVNYAGFTNQPTGTFSGAGWQSVDITVSGGDSGSCHYDNVSLTRSFPPARFTRIAGLMDFLVGADDGGCGPFPDININLYLGGVLVGSATGDVGGSGSNIPYEWLGDVVADQVDIRMVASSYRPVGGGSAGDVLITMIQAEGFGDNPVGDNNCP